MITSLCWCTFQINILDIGLSHLGTKICVVHDDFFIFMKQVLSEPIHGFSLQKLVAKCKREKLALKTWNHLVFGQIDIMIKELDSRLILLEKKLQSDYTWIIIHDQTNFI